VRGPVMRAWNFRVEYNVCMYLYARTLQSAAHVVEAHQRVAVVGFDSDESTKYM
jgi:hypothetical protein